jgi:hypothetical protein
LSEATETAPFGASFAIFATTVVSTDIHRCAKLPSFICEWNSQRSQNSTWAWTQAGLDTFRTAESIRQWERGGRLSRIFPEVKVSVQADAERCKRYNVSAKSFSFLRAWLLRENLPLYSKQTFAFKPPYSHEYSMNFKRRFK